MLFNLLLLSFILYLLLFKIFINLTIFRKTQHFSNKQFGFRRGRSTEDAARLLTDTVTLKVNKGERNMCVFLDLVKAFDTISTDLLQKKLEAAGIRGSPLDCFKSYLTNRRQFVKLGDLSSGLLPINFGIPQGSTLGPSLFLIYINDNYLKCFSH